MGINQMLKQRFSPMKTAIVRDSTGLAVEHFLAGKRKQTIAVWQQSIQLSVTGDHFGTGGDPQLERTVTGDKKSGRRPHITHR
jgi:hypothetical protein